MIRAPPAPLHIKNAASSASAATPVALASAEPTPSTALITVFIKNMAGDVIALEDVACNALVSLVKRRVHAANGMLVARQRLVWMSEDGGQAPFEVLVDARTLESYGVVHETTLNVVVTATRPLFSPDDLVRIAWLADQSEAERLCDFFNRHGAQDLSMTNRKLSRTGFQTLAAALAGNASIRQVSVSKSDIHADEVVALVQCASVRTLSVHSSQLDDDDAVAIAAAIQGSTSLTRIHMFDNPCTKTGAGKASIEAMDAACQVRFFFTTM